MQFVGTSTSERLLLKVVKQLVVVRLVFDRHRHQFVENGAWILNNHCIFFGCHGAILWHGQQVQTAAVVGGQADCDQHSQDQWECPPH